MTNALVTLEFLWVYFVLEQVKYELLLDEIIDLAPCNNSYLLFYFLQLLSCFGFME